MTQMLFFEIIFWMRVQLRKKGEAKEGGSHAACYQGSEPTGHLQPTGWRPEYKTPGPVRSPSSQQIAQHFRLQANLVERCSMQHAERSRQCCMYGYPRASRLESFKDCLRLEETSRVCVSYCSRFCIAASVIS